MDELLGDRIAHRHLPLSLVATTGDRDGKKEKGSIDSKIPETHQEPVADDAFVDSRELLNETGQLMLFQLPACVPVPIVRGVSPSSSAAVEMSPSTGLNPSSLLEGPLAATTLIVEGGDKAVDIETFKTIQEQQWRDQQLARQAHKWPIGAEGRLGRLRVHASGKVTLLINNTVWQAVASSYHPGKTGSGQQRVVAIDADYHQSFDLGSLTSHYVFIPDPL